MQLSDARTGRPLDPARGPRRDTRGRIVPQPPPPPSLERSDSSAGFFSGLGASAGLGGSERRGSEEEEGEEEKKEGWRETRKQQREAQRLATQATLAQQGRSVVVEAPGVVPPEALPLVGFLVCGAGEQLLNGVYLATPQLNEGAPVFHHGLGYLLTRECIQGTLGWVIGMPPSVCYGFATNAELPPREGWAVYGARPRAPKLRELRSAFWAVAGWAEHSLEHVLGFSSAAATQAAARRQEKSPHGVRRASSTPHAARAREKELGQRFATRQWIELAGGFLRMFKSLRETAPEEEAEEAGEDDPIARRQTALLRAGSWSKARAEGHHERPSRELWLPEYTIDHDEDDEGPDGLGSRELVLRLVGGTAYLSGSQVHRLQLDSGADASAWAVALRETQRCFDGCPMMQSPSAHLSALEKRAPPQGRGGGDGSDGSGPAKKAQRSKLGAATPQPAVGEGFDDLEEEKAPVPKRRARASFAMLHGAGSLSASAESFMLNERRGSEAEGGTAFDHHVKAETEGIPWDTVRNMRRSGRLLQRLRGSTKWRERFVELDLESKTVSLSEPPTEKRFDAQKLAVVALAGYTVEHVTKPAESGATRRNAAGDDVPCLEYLLHLWPPPAKAGETEPHAVQFKATTPEESMEWAHSFEVIIELCRRNEEELINDFMLFQTRATATGITEPSPEDLAAAEERRSVFVFKEGVVFKQPHSQRGWHRRYFVLEDDHFRYYNSFEARCKEQAKEQEFDAALARGDTKAAAKLEKLRKDKKKRTIRLTPGTELISQLTIGLWDEHTAMPTPGGGNASAKKMRDHTEPIFTVRASTHHKFVLRADSQGEMADWLKAIKHNIEILRKPYWTKAVESMRAAACLSAKLDPAASSQQ